MGYRKKVILVSPLDWGLGHASRCIPIIRFLLLHDCEVIIAADEKHHELFRQEFPGIAIVNLPGYRLRFGFSRRATIRKIILHIPSILASIRREKRWLQKYLTHHPLDAVISDNRYGLYNARVKSVFITHQLTIKTPFGKFADSVLRTLNYQFIDCFDQCWLPDFPGVHNLAGGLSHPLKMPAPPSQYLGRLTRFEKSFLSVETEQLLILLSGPEPQRSILESILLSQLKNYKNPVILVRGLPGQSGPPISPVDHIRVFDHLETPLLKQAIDACSVIISRSGYSTIMDILGRGKKCIFIPTPGQTEQEYLADYLSEKHYCLAFKQYEFELMHALHELQQREFVPFENETVTEYQDVLEEFVRSL